MPEEKDPRDLTYYKKLALLKATTEIVAAAAPSIGDLTGQNRKYLTDLIADVESKMKIVFKYFNE